MASPVEISVESSAPLLLCIQMKKTNQFSINSSVFSSDQMPDHIEEERSILSESTVESILPMILIERSEGTNSKLDLVNDRLETLAMQEEKYKIRDYIGRRARRQRRSNLHTLEDNNDHSEIATIGDFGNVIYDDDVDNIYQNATLDCADHGFELNDESMINMDVDISCREKMCEWSYKICDHFQTSRDIVSIAFNYLDRFNDVTRCDRTAFKLASMTCLYIATKVFHNKQLSVSTLSDLSRNEFTSHHILQMERVILSTLDYRMNPPTIQAYLQQFQFLFPVSCFISSLDPQNTFYEYSYDDQALITSTMNDIFDRATYYGELVVYDYSLISEPRYLVAISCLLNAINDVIVVGTHDDSYCYQQQHCEQIQSELISMIQTSFSSISKPLNINRIHDVQERLWYLYSCSPDYQQSRHHYYFYSSQYSTTYEENAKKTPKVFAAKTKTSDRSVNAQKSLPSSASPISVLPTRERFSGLSPDKFSVRIF
jgi:Cyclin, N-terminal domain